MKKRTAVVDDIGADAMEGSSKRSKMEENKMEENNCANQQQDQHQQQLTEPNQQQQQHVNDVVSPVSTRVLPELPRDLFVVLVPFAFDTLRQAKNLMLVCKGFHALSKKPVFWMEFLKRKWAINIEAMRPFVDQKLLKVMVSMRIAVPEHILKSHGMRAIVTSCLFPAEKLGYRFMDFRHALDAFGKDALEMKDGMFTGFGMELWPGDRVYCGYLSEGTADGPGVLYAVNRRVEGSWTKGALEGPIMTRYSNGSWCEGYYCRGNYNGLCKYYNHEMRFTIRGIFENSRFNGPGKLMYDNGVTLEGEFSDDRLMKTCVVRWANDDSYVGMFVKGKRVGRGVFYDAASDTHHDQTWVEGDDAWCLDGAAIHLQHAEKGVVPLRIPPSMQQKQLEDADNLESVSVPMDVDADDN